ncbi:MAG: GTP-binding protein [archaeon]|nr:GTP-binding protein [archaeon]
MESLPSDKKKDKTNETIINNEKNKEDKIKIPEFEDPLVPKEKKENIKEEENNENGFDFIKEVRLAVIGNVDSGKSTLVGCLTKNIKDDGRGYARKFVFNFQHEEETGRTSSIAEEILGFKDFKPLEIGRANEKKNISWKEIAAQSDHVITMIDLCGHEKYLKTTMYGITALMPDYAMILIGTNMGVQRMTKEHLGIAASLELPFFIVFTKIDIAPPDVKEKTINTFCTLLKKGLQKTVFVIKNEEDAKACAESILGGMIVPVFQISTVTGEGLDYLKYFLARLTPRHSSLAKNSLIKNPEDPVEMLFDSAFNTKVGIIHAGVLISGTIRIGEKYLYGPTSEGQMKPIQIKNIQFLRGDVNEIKCGNSCSLKLKSLDKSYDLTTTNFRKGMVLVPLGNKLLPSKEFEIEAMIVHHASTIKVGYQSVVHCNVVRQTATIIGMNKDFMRAGDCGIIKFQFLKAPEYLHIGDTVLFREGRTRGKGKIIKLYPYDEKRAAEEKEKLAQRGRKKNFKPMNGIKNETGGNTENESNEGKGNISQKNSGVSNAENKKETKYLKKKK